MRLAVLALAALIGCAAEEPMVEQPSFRDRSVPIASQVDVLPTDLVGWWRVRATTEPLLVGGRFVVRYDEGRRLFSFNDAAFFEPSEGTGQFDQLEEDGVTIDSIGPGRLSAVASPFAMASEQAPFIRTVLGPMDAAEIWILWADADRRTMAIGTPDGAFGFILDRNETGGEDRIAAARDIMEWMGYRVDEMVTR